MSNHYHRVLHVDLDQAKQWTDREVIQRWGTLFTKSIAALVVAGQPLTPAQKNAVDLQMDTWRERLSDISWFMRCINEPFRRRLLRLHHRLEALVQWKNLNEILAEIIKKVKRKQPRILTFVEHEDVPSHNN